MLTVLKKDFFFLSIYSRVGIAFIIFVLSLKVKKLKQKSYN